MIIQIQDPLKPMCSPDRADSCSLYKPTLPNHTTSILRSIARTATEILDKASELSDTYNMGSLMAGWDSPVLVNPDSAKLERNKSLTKEEIDTFWKGQRKVLHVEIDDKPNGSSPISPTCPFLDGSLSQKRISTPPLSPAEREKDDKNGDWWTRSNWAFLNEPPKDEMTDSTHKYTAQFHVAGMASSNK